MTDTPAADNAAADGSAASLVAVGDHPTPLEAEVLGYETVEIQHGELTFVVPASLEDTDSAAIDALDDGKLSYFLRVLFGPAQWKQFKATKPKVRDYKTISEAYLIRVGFIVEA